MIKKTPSDAELKQISPSKIERNPENPRLFFRTEELDTLMASIAEYGIQVPITVYKEHDHYVLIDGERRWRCADKLNLKSIPALVQEKPSPLENLLLMFNIHALREQWDYFTIANKIPTVIDEFIKERGREPNEIELSEATGLTRGQIRRCRFLIDLPPRYKRILIEELSLPKERQQLSEDFFIEMERSLKTVQARIPDSISNINEVRDTLIVKFRSKVIGNITDFRKLSKIATSIEKLGTKVTEARSAVKSIFSHNKTGIDKVYSEHFALRYSAQKLLTNIESLKDYLENITQEKKFDALTTEIKEELGALKQLIDRVIND